MTMPMGPVSLTENISTRATTREITAEATGPKRKPPMQMTVSFRSSWRKPATWGSILLRYITTYATAVSMPREERVRRFIRDRETGSTFTLGSDIIKALLLFA